ncbi:MAG: mandelate racemase/muconate lactonizing enzyme family protein, partial [Rhodobacterales bacterium]|nr:mandelate racemase/muconate lactonizing enzyme family protein [Rhodobacterales bacterium]
MFKITKIESFCNEYIGFVRLTNEDGAQGWGQVSTYNSDITCQILHRQVAPWTLGQKTEDLDDLLDLVTEREHKFPGSYLRRAMGGFDTAIWDMKGKVTGQPVVKLLGGNPGSL